MIACFFSIISAKYYKNPSMLSRAIAKNVGDVFFETQCRWTILQLARLGLPRSQYFVLEVGTSWQLTKSAEY